MFDGLRAKACITRAAYLVLDIIANKTGGPASAGFFEGRQIWEVLSERTAYIIRAAYSSLDRSLKIHPVVQQHRLELLKTVRFGRYFLNELVW